MTAHAVESTAHPIRRSPRGLSTAWKSSILAGSIGGVLLGWAVLTHSPASAQSTAAQVASTAGQAAQPVQSTAPVARSQGSAAAQSGTAPTTRSQTTRSGVRAAPNTLQQQPQFSRPVTRTRHS